MFKLKRFNQVQEGLSSQDFASGEYIMRFKLLIPADYLQIRSGQRINLHLYTVVQNLELKSSFKLHFVIQPFNFINIYTFLLLNNVYIRLMNERPHMHLLTVQTFSKQST